MPDYPITARNKVRRIPRRGRYDRKTIHAIIDEALLCHVAFVQGRVPMVIPTLHARLDDTLLIHGARSSRLLRHLAEGHPVSVAITLFDGLVLARSVFHSSANYRSVVIHGNGRLLVSNDDKLEALEAFAEHVAPGRWNDARLPNRQELKATSVIAIPIDSASAKVRTGPPLDEKVDYALPVWAGVIPFSLEPGKPQRDPKLRRGLKLPRYLKGYSR
jgi:nitroimidazol reductase NimA-like FMN-containing flavoprotein (pyridoxamine 5'-phosphate oxidase superfamily)